jgi:hypothetical protein
MNVMRSVPELAGGDAASNVSPINLSREEAAVVAILTLVAFGLGAITIARTVDTPGDGPTRAMGAYLWSLHPHIETYGVWLPAYQYMMGICLRFVRDPMLVPRVVNLIAGALTIPALYLLICEIYGNGVAILSAAMLAILPLHVGLSASELTEAGFLFYMVASILFLTRTVASSTVRIVPFFLFLGFFLMGEMTRYEAWALIAPAVFYLYLRSRDSIATALAAGLLIAFPLAWSVSSYRHTGDFFYGIHAASNLREGGASVRWSGATAYLGAMTYRQLGWLVASAAGAGLILEWFRAIRGSIGVTRIAYVTLVSVVWIIDFKGAVSRGPALYDRYLLYGFALALPMAAVLYCALFGSTRAALAVGVVVFSGSVALAYWENHPFTYVTREKPTDIIELVQWLQTSRYRNSAVITTELDWNSSYLQLYAMRSPATREAAAHYFVASVWTDDEWIRTFIEYNEPALLVTQPKDGDDRAHIERVLGRALPLTTLVHVSGNFQVYDISSVMSGPAR